MDATHPTPPSAEPSRTSATRAERKSLGKDREVLRNTAARLGSATGAAGSAEQALTHAARRPLQCADETGHVPPRDGDDVSEAKSF